MMNRNRFKACVCRFAPVVLALAVLLLAAQRVWACPTCSEAVAANDPAHEHMVKGYFYSILFMMGMPYTVFMCFVGYMYWEVRKARARKAQEALLDAANSTKPLLPAAAAVVPADSSAAEAVSHAAENRELVEV
jgi:heme/copper-type cytochrome/quinol oxidase subunit 2